ncbi:MAG: alpha-galactosidase [Propionibacteriaceae bacterium]|nr:alpha-galactosidase [Propionibacteriaceae bacterium]
MGMISVADGVFRLDTRSTSYWFRVTKYGHLEHLWYGSLLPDDQDPTVVGLKHPVQLGTAVAYREDDLTYSLDALELEWSGVGTGDYRQSPLVAVLPNGTRTSDFTYVSYEIVEGVVCPAGLPSARAGAQGTRPEGDDCLPQTLIVTLRDEAAHLDLLLHYTVFPDVDCITRRAVLVNKGEDQVRVSALASLMLDMPNRHFRLLTLNGGWIKEAHIEDAPLRVGLTVNSSTTGVSSNRHNPGFILASGQSTETSGKAYGFNLVYSGNHCGVVERTPDEQVRVVLGINPAGFEWLLGPGESFETPEAVMTYSAQGIGEVSRNFHRFVNDHIVPVAWARRDRPVVYNNWEATFFRFTSSKLLSLAKQAQSLGAEVFVLDDGWFGARDSDSAGLGDYSVNRRKFPSGLPHFAEQIRGLGMGFGVWVEPEMINEDSDLFRAHPDWAVTTPGRTPSKGRHQLILDLTRDDVRDYIVENVGHVIDSTKAAYIKWDFNRPFSDVCSAHLANQGEFAHRYVLGLYDVLARFFSSRPEVLLESCSSGGNRFDLGMLAYSPQVWASDDTDPIERLAIQGGLSLLYPQSTMGAHISDAPHQQTLRDTPLTTRFNVAAFGCFGLEMDVRMLSPVERREIREEVAFYKEHRSTFQYGDFYRGDREAAAKGNKVQWTVVTPNGSEAIVGLFQTLAQASEGVDILAVDGLDAEARYRFETRKQALFISRFGGLVKHLIPVTLNPSGAVLRTADKVYAMHDGIENYTVCGAALAEGIPLSPQFLGTGYDSHLRILGDFGSQVYVITRV